VVGNAAGLIVLAAAIIWYGQVQIRRLKQDLLLGKALGAFALPSFWRLSPQAA
jgi:hypothetical protein